VKVYKPESSQATVSNPQSAISNSQPLILSLILALIFSSCAPRRPPIVAPPVTLPSAQQLLAALVARRQAVKGLRGLAEVVYVGPQEKGKVKQAVAVATPNQFRLELFSLLGVASLLTCDGHALAAYFPKEKVLYRGAATPLNIARFARITLAAREVADLLLGLPMAIPHAERGSVSFDLDTGWYRLDITVSGNNAQTLWFDTQAMFLQRWELTESNGEVVARMNLTDYRAVVGQYFPFHIELIDPQGQQQASVTYERVELNPSLSESLFTLGTIAGVRELDMDTVAGER
jgi:hypothetical protein